MSANGIVNERTIMEIARTVGLSVRRLRRDMSDPEIQTAIDRNLALDQSLNITGTLSFVIGERIFRGSADMATLQALVECERWRRKRLTGSDLQLDCALRALRAVFQMDEFDK